MAVVVVLMQDRLDADVAVCRVLSADGTVLEECRVEVEEAGRGQGAFWYWDGWCRAWVAETGDRVSSWVRFVGGQLYQAGGTVRMGVTD